MYCVYWVLLYLELFLFLYSLNIKEHTGKYKTQLILVIHGSLFYKIVTECCIIDYWITAVGKILRVSFLQTFGQNIYINWSIVILFYFLLLTLFNALTTCLMGRGGGSYQEKIFTFFLCQTYLHVSPYYSEISPCIDTMNRQLLLH